jgi:hypothetical protein
MNLKQDVLCMDDPYEGIALCRLTSGDRTTTFLVPATTLMTRHQVRNVIFHDEDCSQVVTGSDHGAVYVFERRTKAVIDVLRTGRSEWVQCVAVMTCPLLPLNVLILLFSQPQSTGSPSSPWGSLESTFKKIEFLFGRRGNPLDSSTPWSRLCVLSA